LNEVEVVIFNNYYLPPSFAHTVFPTPLCISQLQHPFIIEEENVPMSSSSNGTSSSHNNGMEGEVMGSNPIGCMSTLPIKKEYLQRSL
jgi:hypothetical protein